MEDVRNVIFPKLVSFWGNFPLSELHKEVKNELLGTTRLEVSVLVLVVCYNVNWLVQPNEENHLLDISSS